MPANPTSATSTALHTHFGALIIGGTFLGVVLMGTLWRLTAAHMVTSDNPTLRRFGEAMAVQY